MTQQGWRASAPAVSLVALFSVAIFLNAALLFSVQPLFTKMVLPLLGGTPAVWNTCLLFFQSVLLAGYLYAHVTSRWLTVRTQAIVHLGLLAAAVLVLPIGIPASWMQPPDSALPIGWLLGLLTVSLGLPFFVLSAGAPILQRWFAGTRHAHAHNPYFLYAASNLGSFVALLAYPFVIEPRLRLSEQSVTWLEFYYALVVLIGASAVAAIVMRSGVTGSGEERRPSTAPAPAIHDKIRWILLAFAPSSLLIGVTTYLTTDIASIPFLWVVPLAIYLLTFVLVFARRQFIPRQLVVHAQLLLGLVVVVSLCLPSDDKIIGPAVLHLLSFFAAAMMCHGDLADRRPDAAHLTEFYLWMSVGGALGGVFNVLIAPVVFDTAVEYAIAVAITFALRPSASRNSRTFDRLADLMHPALVAAVIWVAYRSPTPPDEWFTDGSKFFLLVMMFAVFFFWKRPLRLALGAIALYGTLQMAGIKASDLLFQDRSFFGIHRVRRSGEFHILQNGTTDHGVQNRNVGHRTDPLIYYHRGGPLSDVFSNVMLKSVRRVALVGLGSGAMACYGRPDESWTFFEIDPVVARIARSPELFSYLTDCLPRTDVVLGDARLKIASAHEGEFDMIFIDAFSSDVVPAHLITREAVALYLAKLRSDGALIFHISNRFMDLTPVLSALASDANLSGAVGDRDPDEAGAARMHASSRWVVMARDPALLTALLQIKDWQSLSLIPPSRLWTDDFSDVLSTIRR